MSEKITKLIEDVKSLTVLELSELVKALEEEFGVSAAAPMAVAAAPAAAGAATAEEKTEFDVVLKAAGDNKIKVVKAVKDITGLGLKEAKEMVDGAPKTIKEKIAELKNSEIMEKAHIDNLQKLISDLKVKQDILKIKIYKRVIRLKKSFPEMNSENLTKFMTQKISLEGIKEKIKKHKGKKSS